MINASIDSSCTSCTERGGVCLDENSDERMDKCFCQADNDLCRDRTTTLSIPETQPIRNKYRNFFFKFLTVNKNKVDFLIVLFVFRL